VIRGMILGSIEVPGKKACDKRQQKHNNNNNNNNKFDEGYKY
jgi:hypothetical protein